MKNNEELANEITMNVIRELLGNDAAILNMEPYANPENSMEHSHNFLIERMENVKKDIQKTLQEVMELESSYMAISTEK